MTNEFVNNVILKYLYKDDKVNVNKIRCKRYQNIRNYLFSYFNDNPSTFTEILFRIKYNIERNYCSICGNPYRCDFYIKSLDLFIEVQGYYTHGKEPYNPNSIKHQILVQKYKERYGPNCQAITIWTIKDVEKRNKAKENNLKYLEIFHKDILKIKQDITILNSIINNFLKDYDN